MAGLGWIVWALFVAASAGKQWVEEIEFGAADNVVKDWCTFYYFVPAVKEYANYVSARPSAPAALTYGAQAWTLRCDAYVMCLVGIRVSAL